MIARLTVRKAPARFVSRTASKSSSLIRMSRLSRVMPALATTTSTGPSFSSTSVKARSRDSASVTSAATASAPSGASPLREVTATVSPAARNSSAMVRPIPRLPPVTRTTRGSDTGLSPVGRRYRPNLSCLVRPRHAHTKQAYDFVGRPE
ncbi:Uncharacterised protein [Mycobacteroides abscessus subsp. abscessus]|nr:Uncharacterised protein [Mycobacteroides abscessus subsp. abscessus]